MNSCNLHNYAIVIPAINCDTKIETLCPASEVGESGFKPCLASEYVSNYFSSCLSCFPSLLPFLPQSLFLCSSFISLLPIFKSKLGERSTINKYDKVRTRGLSIKHYWSTKKKYYLGKLRTLQRGNDT